jgi:hypothetical protein
MPGAKSVKTIFTTNCTRFDFDFYDGFHCVEAPEGTKSKRDGLFAACPVFAGAAWTILGSKKTRSQKKD